MPPPLSLYIHLPWCLHKCAYCDFNSHAAKAGAFPEQDYTQQLITDLIQTCAALNHRPVQSIFLGGGTPSLFSPRSIDAILTACKQFTAPAEDCEITLEANPGSYEVARFAEFLACGVNRLSIGVQSFNDRCLNALGRIHNGRDALNAIQSAQQTGFNNINIDLMFALPRQSLAGAIEDMAIACRQNVAHISYYQLTLEPNTVFYRFPPPLPDQETSWQIQQRAIEQLAAAGLQRYEVSAYCRPGAHCIHNANYWQYGDYLGLGAGAHSKLTFAQGAVRQQRPRQPSSYMQAVRDNRQVINAHSVSEDEMIFEFMLNNLRLVDGFTERHFAAVTGLAFSAVDAKINACVKQGLLERQDQRIKASSLGYRFLNNITEQFLPDKQPLTESEVACGTVNVPPHN